MNARSWEKSDPRHKYWKRTHIPTVDASSYCINTSSDIRFLVTRIINTHSLSDPNKFNEKKENPSKFNKLIDNHNNDRTIKNKSTELRDREC